MKILITSGGTKISIDRVRSISNMSRGTFGSAICKAFLEAGHEVDFLMAKDSRTPFELKINSQDERPLALFEEWEYFVRKNESRYHPYIYKTFDDYYNTVSSLVDKNEYDIIVLAAAVSDYGVKNCVPGKIRSSEEMAIEMEALPKVISFVRRYQPSAFFVGFKLLVDSVDEELVMEARKSLFKNECDMVVANDLRDIQQGKHRLLVVTVNDVKVRETEPDKHLSVQLVEDILAKFE